MAVLLLFMVSVIINICIQSPSYKQNNPTLQSLMPVPLLHSLYSVAKIHMDFTGNKSRLSIESLLIHLTICAAVNKKAILKSSSAGNRRNEGNTSNC